MVVRAKRRGSSPHGPGGIKLALGDKVRMNGKRIKV